MRNKKALAFWAVNVLMWGVMTVLLVLVPDVLEPSVGFELSRAVGWAVACGVWVIVLESAWKERCGTLARFGLQLVLWVSAALVASWISNQARPWGWGG